MQVFRRVVLPILYLIVLLIIAVSLAWLAFAPSGESGSDDVFATGELVGTEAYVERGSSEASPEADGTIAIADPVAAKPGHDGTVNHIWVRPGMVVEEGDDLFQVTVEEAPDEAAAPDESEDGDDAPAPAPEPRRTYHTVTAPADGTVGSFDLQVGDDVAKGAEALTVTPRTCSASADDVLTVPVTAVRGMGEDASVWVTDDMGEPEERSVEIGMSDGTRAEVVSGLEAGDAILEYVPGTEPDEDEGMDFGMIG